MIAIEKLSSSHQLKDEQLCPMLVPESAQTDNSSPAQTEDYDFYQDLHLFEEESSPQTQHSAPALQSILDTSPLDQSQPQVSTHPQAQVSENQVEVESQESIHDPSYGERQPRGRYASQNDHYIKNFLQKFKSVFLKYLKNKYGDDKEFFSIKVVADFKRKDQPSKKDYQNLMNYPAFHAYFEEFFESKVLYHHLASSGVATKRKVFYEKRLFVFERAFIEGKFESICK